VIPETPTSGVLEGPVTVGVTGPFASGKSTFVKLLGELGAETVSSDGIVHELLTSDNRAIERVIERFGENIRGESGIDRAALAREVFGDSQALEDLEEGQVVQGVVSNLVDFGAFVDLEGIDGLIHISELSWNHVDHPSEVVEVGDEVEVKVLEVDRDRERISLGLKQTRKDPWQEIVEQVEVGGQIKGRVTKLVAFGAFVEVAEGVEGLIHISELAEHHVETPDEIIRSGDEVDARIIDVDAKRRRLSLSLKPKKDESEEKAERAEQQRPRPERTERPRREERPAREASNGSGLRSGAFDSLSDLDLGGEAEEEQDKE
ncbi:MAG: dephospho-CoA kinase, partial [Rubrobacteraceae bacterium]